MDVIGGPPEPAAGTDVAIIGASGFDIPPDNGQSVAQLVEEVSPGYLRACLDMARRAMTGLVNPFTEGDLPHKMALLLAHRMTPGRKWDAKMPDAEPAETKKAARALKSIIQSLQEDGEIIIDRTNLGMDNVGRGAGGGTERAAGRVEERAELVESEEQCQE